MSERDQDRSDDHQLRDVLDMLEREYSRLADGVSATPPQLGDARLEANARTSGRDPRRWATAAAAVLLIALVGAVIVIARSSGPSAPSAYTLLRSGPVISTDWIPPGTENADLPNEALGVLDLSGSCTLIRSAHTSSVIVWPLGTTWQNAGRQVILPDHVVLHAGDPLTLTGRRVPGHFVGREAPDLADQIEQCIGAALPAQTLVFLYPPGDHGLDQSDQSVKTVSPDSLADPVSSEPRHT